VLVQQINKIPNNTFDLAYKYFSILSVLNELGLVKRDLQLLAYACSQEQNISDVKKVFIKEYNTSLATVGNIISKLYKLKVLRKEKKEVIINPAIVLDFNEDIMLVIKYIHNKENNEDNR
jgi:hypothetical protein